MTNMSSVATPKPRNLPEVNPALLPRVPKMIPPLIQRNPIPLRTRAQTAAAGIQPGWGKSKSLSTQKVVKLVSDHSTKVVPKTPSQPKGNPALSTSIPRHVTPLIQRNPIPLRTTSVRPTPSAFIRMKEEEKEAAAAQVVVVAKKTVRASKRPSENPTTPGGSTRKGRKGVRISKSEDVVGRRVKSAPAVTDPEELASGSDKLDSESLLPGATNDDQAGTTSVETTESKSCPPGAGSSGQQDVATSSRSGTADSSDSEAPPSIKDGVPRKRSSRKLKRSRSKTTAGKRRPVRVSKLLPAHVPGPKTDNLFIGYYSSKENMASGSADKRKRLTKSQSSSGVLETRKAASASSHDGNAEVKKVGKKGKGQKAGKPKTKGTQTADQDKED